MATKTRTTRSRVAGRAAAAVLDDETSVEVRARKKKAAAAAKPPAASADPEAGMTIAEALGVVPGLLGGKPRQTLPANANVLGNLPYAFLPRRSYQAMDLTTLQPGAYSPQQLLELLADAWPELSQALWNILRLAAAEWRYDVRTPDNAKDDPEGKAELDQILARVNVHWGGFDALINQWVMCVALQGACAGETIPNETIDDVWDMAAVQPWTIFFQRDIEQQYVAFQWQPMTVAGGGAGTGQSGSMTGGSKPGVFDPTAKQPAPSDLMQIGALQHGGFRRLNETTFGYVPLDSDVDDPYGRAPFASVLQLVVWDMQIIKDLRQWSHVNAFGRIDVKVVAEAAKAMMPPAVAANKKDARLWFRKYLEDIQSAYNNLNPDDTYVHFDNVEVSSNDPSGKTFDVDKLIKVLERRIFRALKQLPILMGSNEGTTETWGTLQMEVYALGIANIQRTVAALITKLLNVALRLRGHASVVNFEFETLRATDRQREASAEWQEMKNSAFARDQGWITQDEASIRVTGSEAVADAPNPDPVVAVDQPDQGSAQPPVADPAGVPDPSDPNAEQGDETPAAGETGAKGKGKGTSKKKPADTQDDKDEGEDDSDRWQRRAHPIRGLDVPARRPASSRHARPAGSAPEAVPAASLAPQYDRHERTVLAEALVATSADLLAERAADEAEEDEAPAFTGAMTAFFLPDDAAEQLAIAGGEPADQLHLTLTYLGEADEIADVEKLRAAVVAFAAAHEPFDGRVAGIGRFTSVPAGAKHPVYASVDAPELAAFRQALAEVIDASGGATVDTSHGYTPHITLAYVDADAETPVESVPALDLHFDTLTLALGGEYIDYPLGAADRGGRQRPATRRLPARNRAVQPAPEERAAQEKTATRSHRPPSAARKRVVERIAGDVAAYFAAGKPSRHRLDHIIDLHRSAATADNKRTWPPLADAVRVILDAAKAPTPRETPREGLAVERLTDEEREALLVSLAKMLEADYPDGDDRLYEAILDARTAAYNLGGNEGLDAIGLAGKGTFELRNADVLGKLQTTARAQVKLVQKTSRTRLAARLADGLAAGDTNDEIAADVGAAVDSWGDYRAANIAEYETTGGYFSGSMELWQRSGVPNKVWVTTADPDPYAGATGETPCRDNAYGSPVGIFETFPSGDDYPPAHNACECDCAPEGDPSESALDAPWLGD